MLEIWTFRSWNRWHTNVPPCLPTMVYGKYKKKFFTQPLMNNLFVSTIEAFYIEGWVYSGDLNSKPVWYSNCPIQFVRPMIRLLYILTSVWVLRTPNAGRNSHFQRFCCKKLKKQEICSKFLQKTVFLSLRQNAGRLFYSQKNKLFSLKRHFYLLKVVNHQQLHFVQCMQCRRMLKTYLSNNFLTVKQKITF